LSRDTFVVETLDEITELLVDDLGNRFADDPLDLSPTSDNWKRERNTAMGIAGLHAHIDVVADDALPDLAEDSSLARWGAIYNVTRKAATAASGANALRLTGTSGSAYTTGDELSTTDGTLYQVNETGTIPVAGFVDVDVLAKETGAHTRKLKGEVLTFSSTPAGLASTAALVADLDVGGADEETEDEWRERILDRMASPGMGGNANDYQEWSLEVEGVREAYVYPNRDGLGTVDLAALHSGTGAERLLSGTEIDELETYVDAKRPVAVQLRVLTVIENENDVHVTIERDEDAEFDPDWDDTTPLVINTYTAGTRTITTTGTLPDDFVEGVRFVYRNVSGNAAFELEVEAINSTTSFTFKEPASSVQQADLVAFPPANGQSIYAGGPLIEPVRQAIQDYANTLGPARGDHAQGSWDDVLRTIRIHAAAVDVTGVRDVTVVAPVANVTPDNIPPATTIELNTLRQILVRYA
jgi:uncharacterized phage protein gp47/JayE